MLERNTQWTELQEQDATSAVPFLEFMFQTMYKLICGCLVGKHRELSALLSGVKLRLDSSECVCVYLVCLAGIFGTGQLRCCRWWRPGVWAALLSAPAQHLCWWTDSKNCSGLQPPELKADRVVNTLPATLLHPLIFTSHYFIAVEWIKLSISVCF